MLLFVYLFVLLFLVFFILVFKLTIVWRVDNSNMVFKAQIINGVKNDPLKQIKSEFSTRFICFIALFESSFVVFINLSSFLILIFFTLWFKQKQIIICLFIMLCSLSFYQLMNNLSAFHIKIKFYIAKHCHLANLSISL